MRLIVLLMVASCAGSQPTPAPLASSVVPAIVAKLFVQGTKWTFPFKRRVVTRDQTDPNDNSKETIETGTATCEVTYAGPRPHGRNARLTCSPTLGSIPLEFAATNEGLWTVYKGEPLPKERLLDEPPRKKHADEVFSEGGAMSGVTTEAPGRWCFYYSGGGMGQGSGWMLCVRDGNFVGGRYSEHGGEPDLLVIEWGEHDERTPI